MAARGPYAKGVAKREAILAAALGVVSDHGYSSATVKEIADAAGVSQNALMHYFGTKEGIFVEILRRRDQVDDAKPYVEGDLPFTLDSMISEVDKLLDQGVHVPGLVQLYSRLSSEASDPAHPLHEYFAHRHAEARSFAADAFRRIQAAGEIRPDLDPDELAVMAVALGDGLQLQWLYDDRVEMPRHMRTFYELIQAPGR